MSSGIKIIISYGGEVVDGHSGVEYVGGSHRLISLTGEINFQTLYQAISNKIGLKRNEKISKIKYRFSFLVGGTVQFISLDIIDDADVQQMLENHIGSSGVEYPQLFIETQQTKYREVGSASFSYMSQAEHVIHISHSQDIGTSSYVNPDSSHAERVQQLDVIAEIDILVATNDCDTPRLLMEDSEGEMQANRDENEMCDVIGNEPVLGTTSQHPIDIPPIFQYSEMNQGVVTADWIGDRVALSYGHPADELCTGMQFEDKIAVKNAVKQYALTYSREFDVKESNSHNWFVVCRNANTGCGWRVRVTKRKRLGDGWEITRYPGPHSCLSRALSLDHRQLDSNFITSCIIDQVKNDPAKSISSIITEIHNWLHFRPSYKKAWEAKQNAIAQIWGDWGESYRRLPYLFAAIKHFNLGTVVEWDFTYETCQTETPVAYNEKILRRVFWAFKPSISSLKFSKPVIQIDGTFLYGKYKHTLLIAITIDGNNSVLPIAYAIVESENKDSWGWFMALLRFYVVDVDGFCVISDRHGGIMATMTNPFLGWGPEKAFHRFCLRHVASNFNTAIKNTGLKNLLIRAGTTCQVRKYTQLMQRLADKSNEAVTWVDTHISNPEQWAMSHDGAHRFGHTNTNVAKCVNAVLKEARQLPICALVEHTFYNSARYFDNRRRFYMTQLGMGKIFSGHCLDLIQRRSIKANSHKVTSFNRLTGIFEIVTGYRREMRKGGNRQIVQLQQRSCSCGKFQAIKIPCSHAMAACMEVGVDYMSLVDSVYSLERSLQCYAESYMPIGNEAYWPNLEDDDGRFVIPDGDTKRGKGQPAGRCHNEMDIGQSNRRRLHCSKCGSDNHNCRRCPGIL